MVREENTLSHNIRPSFAHAARFCCIQAEYGATAGHATSDAMGGFMTNDVVLEGTVPVRLIFHIVRPAEDRNA